MAKMMDGEKKEASYPGDFGKGSHRRRRVSPWRRKKRDFLLQRGYFTWDLEGSGIDEFLRRERGGKYYRTGAGGEGGGIVEWDIYSVYLEGYDGNLMRRLHGIRRLV